MAKACIFCGRPPEKKNKEHVIPQWLIELTGDPKRTIRVGYSYGNDFKPIEFSLSALVFPACSTCNNDFAVLEDYARDVVLKVLANKELTELDVNIILDWLDKVRIGLWLGYFNLDDFLRVHPRFHISQRIGLKDRVLFIYKSNIRTQGLILSGVQTPVFRLMPSCFGLCVNDTFFLNASFDSLVSRRLGFPYLVDWQALQDSPLEEAQYAKGKNRITTPILRFPYPIGATAFYQPVFKNSPVSLGGEWANEYVMSNSLDFNLGLGGIFWSKRDDIVQRLPEDEFTGWVPDRLYDHRIMVCNHSRNVLALQNFIFDLAPGSDYLSDGEAKSRRNIQKIAKRFNRFLMKNTKVDRRQLLSSSELL